MAKRGVVCSEAWSIQTPRAVSNSMATGTILHLRMGMLRFSRSSSSPDDFRSATLGPRGYIGWHKQFEPPHPTRDPLHTSMILFHDITGLGRFCSLTVVDHE